MPRTASWLPRNARRRVAASSNDSTDSRNGSGHTASAWRPGVVSVIAAARTSIMAARPPSMATKRDRRRITSGETSVGSTRVRFTAAMARIGTSSVSFARRRRPCVVPISAAMLSICVRALAQPVTISMSIEINAAREKRRVASTA